MSFRAARDLAQQKQQSTKEQQQQKTKNSSSSTPATDATSTPSSSTFNPRPSHHPSTSTPSTRLCLKNLPVHLKEDRLRKIFSEKGEVTDVKLLKTSDGRSRKMAFIGFRSVADATKALQHFNKTFIDTSKIDVEYAVNPREAKEALQPWSRHSEGSSRYAEAHAPRGDAETDESKSKSKSKPSSTVPSAFSKSALFGLQSNSQLSALLHDKKFQEYLHVMGSRSKNKFWSNTQMDIDASSSNATMSESDMDAVRNDASFQTYEEYLKEQKKNNKKAGGDGDDDEEDEEYFNQPMLDRDVDEAEEKAEVPAAGKSTTTKSKKSPSASSASPKLNPLVLNEAVSDLDYLKTKSTKDFDDDSDVEMEKNDEEGEQEDEQKGDEKSNKKDKASRKRKTSGADDEDQAIEDDGENDADEDGDLKAAYDKDASAAKASAEEEALKRTEADEVMDTGRLFLRNLSYSVRESDLRELFAPFGTISEIHIPVDELSKSKGFAHISFLFPAQALAAQRSLDGSFFLGRLLHILNGKPKPVVKSEWEKLQEMSDDAKNSLTYKKKKELEIRALAGTKKDQASWNTLFIRSDTVTDAIASKYGLNKADIMDTSASSTSGESGNSGSLAVRLALAETTLINETKSFLRDHGVDLTVFDQPKSSTVRSDVTLLVKNLPFNTELDEIRRLFSAHGSLGQVVMPPSRTVALVEFIEPKEAQKAFKALAYKKFKFVPLYLEWAPKGTFSGKVGNAGAGAAAGAAGVIEGKKSSAMLDAGDEDQANSGGDVTGTTLYVKNLNFTTIEATLESIFSRIGAVRSVTISMKKNTKARPHTNDPAFLSMGFGFIEFRKGDDARKALTQLQGVQVDNHALEIKMSERKSSAGGDSNTTTAKPRTAAAAAHVAASAASGATASDGSAAPNSKLLVKNVPFETTARELRELFSAFGTIQRLRLPKKFGQLGHRGFAFIDFTTKGEAKNAYENVRHGHILGRHLIIEYAAATVDSGSQDVDALREKTKEQFKQTQSGAPPHKKRKVAEDDGDEIDQAFSAKFK